MEILAIGPDTRAAFQKYWADKKIPYPGLPDPKHRIAARYQQEVNLFKLGRMPLICVVDREGYIRYVHYASSMSDIPKEQNLLDVIDQLNASSNGKQNIGY